MISLIIDSTQNWSLEDGYRNIHASIGITLDSMFRNKIGDMAESLIKYRMIAWLKAKRIIPIDKPKSREYDLPNDMLMRYRSEPDIEFTRGICAVPETLIYKGFQTPQKIFYPKKEPI